MHSPSLILTACLLFAPVETAPPLEKTIAKLIAQLGNDDFDKREEAEARLQKIGEPALDALREAARTHADVEVRGRTVALVRRIQKDLRSEITHFGPGGGYWLNRVAFSPDGKKVIATGGGVIWYDPESGRELNRVMELQYARCGFAMSADGKHFLTGHQHDLVVRMGNLDSGKEVQTFRGHTGGVFAVAFSPDGKYAVSGGADKTLRLWDTKSGKELRRFDSVTDETRSVSFAPDGNRVASGSWGAGACLVRLCDVETGKLVREFTGHTSGVSAMLFTSDRRQLVSAGMDGQVIVWNVETGKEIRRMTHEGGIYEAALSPDGKRLLTAGWEDRTVRLWELATGKERRRLDGHAGRVLGVAFAPDGKRAVSSDANCTIFLWKLPD